MEDNKGGRMMESDDDLKVIQKRVSREGIPQHSTRFTVTDSTYSLSCVVTDEIMIDIGESCVEEVTKTLKEDFKRLITRRSINETN